jgi:DNA polymerase-3 subunit gamma/tau
VDPLTNQEAYQALYRRWRPQRFSEVIAQQYTVQTLKNAITQGEISHAYLFAGPRGTGKTSVARIFAKAINCPNREDGEPCDSCQSCQKITRGSSLDVIEIDGASNRGIDQIRQLREEVNFAPAESRYKVYIIDEVHMLTHEAFNALLKTLEEPPAHVVFIFATTEPHKVPPTVMSRCQAFEFKTIPREQIEAYLKEVAKAEAIEIEEAAISAIARHAWGALRDALVLLEQLVSYKGRAQITLQDLYEVLGLPPEELLAEFSQALIEGDGPRALGLIAELSERGRDLELFLAELIHHSRDVLIEKLEEKGDDRPGNAQDWVRLTGQLLEVKQGMRYAFDKRMYLEIKALEIIRSLSSEPTEASPKRAAEAEKPQEPSPTKGAKLASTPSGSRKAPSTSTQLEGPSDAQKGPPSGRGGRWSELLERVKQERVAVHALLAEAKVHEREGTLVIEYPQEYGFHKERLEQPENLKYLRSLVEEIYGGVQLLIRFSQPQSQAAGEPTKGEALREKAELVRRTFDGEITR